MTTKDKTIKIEDEKSNTKETIKKEEPKQKPKVEKEIKYSAEIWARQKGLDPVLFLWWTNQGLVYTESEFESIRSKVYKQ